MEIGIIIVATNKILKVHMLKLEILLKKEIQY
jgi:hypothetical protein